MTLNTSCLWTHLTVTDLKKEWCSTQTFHSLLAALWFSSLKPIVDSNWSNWRQTETQTGQSGHGLADHWYRLLCFMMFWLCVKRFFSDQLIPIYFYFYFIGKVVNHETIFSPEVEPNDGDIGSFTVGVYICGPPQWSLMNLVTSWPPVVPPSGQTNILHVIRQYNGSSS